MELYANSYPYMSPDMFWNGYNYMYAPQPQPCYNLAQPFLQEHFIRKSEVLDARMGNVCNYRKRKLLPNCRCHSSPKSEKRTAVVAPELRKALKTPPAHASQRKQLERAKTGDILRHKIQQRPDRQVLIDHNILEDTTAHPSLVEKQRLLKRARLLDGLNDRLANRPGPLELVEREILPVRDIQEAIKDGTVRFAKTSEADEPAKRSSYRSFVFDEDSNVSDNALSPLQNDELEANGSTFSSSMSNSSIPSPPDISAFLQAATQQAPIAQPPVSTFTGLTSPTKVPFSQPAYPTNSFSVSSPTNSISSISSLSSAASIKNGSSTSNYSSSSKSRTKKSKPKTSAKAKVIKFHEYKGPPSVVKNQQQLLQNSSETAYNILLQQQQMFLQWQLEQQQNNLPFILPQEKLDQLISLGNAANMAASQSAASSSTSSSVTSVAPSTTSTSTIIQSTVHLDKKPPSSLEEMKVADLRAELKKRNLAVSGSKPQLLSRLKPYAEAIIAAAQGAATSSQVSSASAPTSFHQQIMSPSSVSQVTSPSSVQHPRQVMSPISFQVMSPASSIMSSASLQVMSPESNMESMNSNHVPNVISRPSTVLQQQYSPVSDINSLLDRCNSNPASPASQTVCSTSDPLSPENMDTTPSFTTTTFAQAFNMSQNIVTIKSTDDIFSQALQSPPTIPMDMMDLEDSGLKQAEQQHQHQIFLQQQQQLQQQLHQQQQMQQMQQLLQLQQQQQQQQEEQEQQQSQSQQQQDMSSNLTRTLSNDDLVRLQQAQIEELQRQLQLFQQQMSGTQVIGTTTTKIKQEPETPQPQQQVMFQPQMVSPQPQLTTQHSQYIIQPPQALSPQASTVPSISVQSSQDVKPTLSKPVIQLSPLPNNQITSLHESLNLTNSKVLSIQTMPDGGQIVITTKADTDSTKQRANTDPLNGLTVHPSSISLPSSPSRFGNFVFPSVPLKEPPKYDEAMKNKPITSTATGITTEHIAKLLGLPESQCGILSPAVTTSQAVEDVLEILIRTGELPASAADAPRTPLVSTSVSHPVPEINTSSISVSSYGAPASAPIMAGNVFFPNNMNNTEYTVARTTDTNTVTVSVVQPSTPSIVIKKEPLTTPTLSTGSNHVTDFSQLLTNGWSASGDDLNLSMEWSGNDDSFELPDFTNSRHVIGNTLAVPGSSASGTSGSVHGSEPNLNTVALSDNDSSSGMNIDISEWLDVILPTSGSGNTPVNPVAPVTFLADPILTPKPLDVLDIFNIEETDFNPQVELS